MFKPRPSLRPLAFAALLLPLGALIYAACVEDDGPDLDALTLRDALGMAPEWLAPRAADERSDLQKRLEAAALQQSEDSAWIELLPQDAAHFKSADPRVAVASLDRRLTAASRDPLLVQWLVIDDGGPAATACPLTADDLKPDPARTADLASGWTLAEDFKRPLSAASDLTERDALHQRLPMLEAWLLRCAEAAGPSLAPEGLNTRLTVLRAESAPVLLTFDPASRAILLNPVLLTLFAPPEDALQTTAQALIPADSLLACVTTVVDYCDRCGEANFYSAANGCGDALLNAASPAQGCATLSEIERGVESFCVNHLLYNTRELDACVDREAESRDCALATPTRSLLSLNGRYLAFLQTPVCVDALEACTDAPLQPGPSDPDDGFVDDPPPQSDSSSDACCDGAANLGCLSLEICAESGALSDACSDTDCGDTDCGDCGDSASGCEGCEGDTF